MSCALSDRQQASYFCLCSGLLSSPPDTLKIKTNIISQTGIYYRGPLSFSLMSRELVSWDYGPEAVGDRVKVREVVK